MSNRRDGLPATSLFLLATALLLFGVGGGMVGYLAGERTGEQRAAAIVDVLGQRWEAHRGDAKSRYAGAIADAATVLEKAASDLKAEVSMYHGCGAICNVIAYQFGTELLHARDAIRKSEFAPPPDWKDVVQESGISVEGDAGKAAAELQGAYSRSTVIIAIALVCATVALCFGMACVTVLKLRTAGSGKSRAEPHSAA